MRPSRRFELPIGVVDRTSDHFVLCHGTDGDPRAWTPIAWLGGTDDAPVAEIAAGLDPDLHREVQDELRSRITVDAASSTFVGTIIDGLPQASWRGSLAYRVGSTSNWYGDTHWKHVSGA